MVNSSDLILQSISLASPPDKTGYNFGENLDLGGMVIKGHYSDMSSKTETVYSYSGYDRTKRGTQTITLSINRKTAEFDVTVKVHAGVTVSVNGYRTGHGDARLEYKHAYAKGTPMSLESLQITVKANGATRIMTLAAGDFTLQELNPTGYDSNKPGNQSPEITLDEKPISLAVYVIDADPQVFFDYGYWRHDGNPNGGPPIAGATPQYTVPLGQTLVITPVAFLMTTLAPSYDWSVSGADYTTSGPGNKFLHITPKAGGLVTANVTVSAGGVSASARANIYCTSPRPGSPPATMDNPSFSGPMPPVQTLGNTSTAPSIRNFAPGQFTKGGTGYGWSLGAAGGYEVWKLRRVNDGTKNFTIRGNPLGGWCEPGIVWVSVDDNQNGLPDDTWYELKGCEEESPIYKPLITRSYGIIYVRDGEAGEVTNEFGQILGGNYWVDTKGRTGRLPGGWPSVWGVNGDRVTFAGTLLRDDGKISTGGYDDLNFNWGYVDTYGTTFNIADAIKADGTAANLPWIDFVKVQTGMFVYGGIFGDVSTEINFADGLGTLTDFPDP